MARKIDAIDIYNELKKRFPHVEFVIEEKIIKKNMNEYGIFVFKLKKLLNTTFEPPIKTSISILQDEELDTDEFWRIETMMQESFSLKKLRGV